MTGTRVLQSRWTAAVLLGIGLGGFFDGIVLHQILQWHHLATSAGYPPDSVENLELNTLLDGLFHAATYLFTLLGVVTLWRAARIDPHGWTWSKLSGGLLVGFGSFNLVEGLVDHQILGLHHVNETVPEEYWIYWDIGFLIWGLAMFAAGLALKRR